MHVQSNQLNPRRGKKKEKEKRLNVIFFSFSFPTDALPEKDFKDATR